MSRNEQIIAWANEGKSSSWIGEQVNVTRSRISQIVGTGVLWFLHSEAGRAVAKARFAKARAEGKNSRGCPHPDHDKRLAAIQEAAAAGRTYADAAKHLGVTRNIIAGMARRHRIKFGHRHP